MAYTSTPVTDLSNLLAAPVLASVDADAQAARHFLRFLESFAFTPPSGDGAERGLAYFTFAFTYMQNGQPKSLVVSLPVLSLVPLPLLNVAKATFDFTLQIVDIRTAPEKRPSVLAMFSEGPSSRASLPGGMGVTMDVVPSDLPAGISRLLNLTADAIQTTS